MAVAESEGPSSLWLVGSFCFVALGSELSHSAECPLHDPPRWGRPCWRPAAGVHGRVSALIRRHLAFHE